MTQKVNSHIGKNLLDMLMFSMYPDAKIIYREYIQNSYDAINAAVKKNILDKPKDGNVTIKIDKNARRITIHDNGTGIPVDDALTVLTSIADSQKDGETQAGVYGIGRLVGAGYCNKLEFRTSAKGEDSATVLSFDVKKTRQILDNGFDRRSATEVMDSIISWDLIPENKDDHYFEVILHNVKEEYPILLSEDDIIEYLKEIAPVDYEMPFKNNIMYQSIDEGCIYYDLQKSLGYITISVNDHTDIRKRYGNKVIGTGDEIVGLQYFTLDDEFYGPLAWGWFAITKFTKAIPTSDPNRGIRLRKHNIQVGEANYLNQYFDEARGNNYFYGEIHVCHKNLRPSTARDGLTPTIEASIFFHKLKDYFKNLKNLYHLANKTKIAVKNIVQATDRINQDDISDKERQEAEKVLNKSKKDLESTSKSSTRKATTNGDVFTKVVEIYTTQLKTDLVRETNQNSYNSSQNDSTTQRTDSSNNSTKDTAGNDVKNQFQSQDILGPITAYYSKDQILIIRKIFKSLSDNCPKSQLTLIEELKKKIIEELTK